MRGSFESYAGVFFFPRPGQKAKGASGVAMPRPIRVRFPKDKCPLHQKSFAYMVAGRYSFGFSPRGAITAISPVAA